MTTTTSYGTTTTSYYFLRFTSLGGVFFKWGTYVDSVKKQKFEFLIKFLLKHAFSKFINSLPFSR